MKPYNLSILDALIPCVIATITLFLSSPLLAENDYSTAEELGLMQGFPPPPEKRVTKATALQTPPLNRWSYQHMRMFYPSAGVPSADKPVPLSKTIDWNFEYDLKVKEPGTDTMKSLADYLKKTFTDAMVVIRGDQIVYEKYLNRIR